MKAFQFSFYVCLLTVMVGLFAGIDRPANAQSKPKLVPITLNEETNDPKAVELARKLNGYYFSLKGEGINEFEYYARFFNYKNTKFMVFQPTDIYMICSAAGCPIFLYANKSGNKWRQVGDFYGHSLVYDLNSVHDKYPNLILRGLGGRGKSENTVFVWNGLMYREARK